jgi:CheY-like chemotaxis protein/anti-sigma regulatory factor (Ser/Thr protein kinase)
MPGKTILIVDDNAVNLTLLQFLLRSEGYDVQVATSGQQALELTRSLSPDLILMDLQLSDMHGFEVTRRLKSDPATWGIPIIAVTAYAMKGDEEKALSAGCDQYVTKPIDTRALPRLIAQQLGQLPREAIPVVSASAKAPEELTEGEREKPLALVVEDNLEMNVFLSLALSRSCRTVSAYDGQEGIEKALALNPDLILSDLLMPRVTGAQLVATLRANPRFDGVPIVLLTGHDDDPALRARLLRAGAQDYLTKPCSAEELDARVGNLLTMKRVREVLQGELRTKLGDIEKMASELAAQKRELRTTLDSVQVARDEAERASRVKTDFLRMVSHELRTPLTTVLLQAQTLARSSSLKDAEQVRVGRLVRACNRLTDLIGSLLDYSQIESGRLNLNVEEFDLEVLAQGIIEEFRPQMESRRLESRLIAPAELPKLRSDRRLAQLVIVNLLSNAIKFTERGYVQVELAHADGIHRVEVRDTGPGIPPEQQVKIYEPFCHLEPLANKHTQGAGLGLSIAQQVVWALGGSIELASKAGMGSKFTVTFPERTGPAVSPSLIEMSSRKWMVGSSLER